MNLARLAVNRHVLAASFSLCIGLFGLVSYNRIAVDRNPDVEIPVITISTTLAGATPDTIAKTVTNPLESSLNTISGTDTLSSTSTTGTSIIAMQFDVNKDLNEAFNDVQTKVNRARGSLPKDADAPVIQKLDTSSQPVLWLSLSGPRSQLELFDIATALQKRLQTLSGVGQVQLVGAPTKQMNVLADDKKLAAYKLTVADVQAALTRNHLAQSGGRIHSAGKEFELKLDFQAYKPSDIANMAITEKNGVVIRIGDIATVTEGTTDSRQFARFNGANTVALGIVKVTGGNTVEVVDNVTRRLDSELKATLPSDLKLAIATDDAKPIRAIISALKEHLLEGTVLTGLIVWLFLKSFRATAVISTAIPVSLLGAVASLYFCGYSLNSFTLLGLLLLVGVVVDDSIVVLENVYKWAEHHPEMSIKEAAEKGSSEVFFAVMAATLTLVCIFVPIVFIPGITGRFFRSFAVVVAVGVLVSWFVAVTLTPMLTSRYMKVTKDGPVAARLENLFRAMEARYVSMLGLVLRHRILTLVLALATLLPAAGAVGKLPKGFMPDSQEGRLVATFNLPAGLSKVDVEHIADRIEAEVKEQPETHHYLTTFQDGGTSGQVDQIKMTITLQDKDIGTRSQNQMMAFFQKEFSAIPGVRAAVTPASSMGGGGGASLQFSLLGHNFDELATTSEAFLNTLRARPGMQTITSNLNLSTPEVTVVLDRERIGRLGLSAQDVALAAASVTGSVILGQYSDEAGDQYNIALQTAAGLHLGSPDALKDVQIRTDQGDFVPLSEVAHLKVEGAAASVTRVDQQYAVTFSANPTISLGEAMADVNSEAAKLGEGYTVKYSGQSQEMGRMGGNLAMVFGMAFVMLYLVLGSQFNSYTQPFLVMLAQPLAVIGGIASLYLTGQGLNIYSMVGLILLTGLVAKNSILLVDRTNQVLDTGKPVNEALVSACPERLRPVLMTSLTIILSLFPAALGFGAGAENNQPMAIAVIGGMVSSTLLTLLVVPAAYSLFVKRHEHA
ncbi:efflux RND transporter permease subunit [Paraburkholderia sp. UCT31]|uniref:efflux RND transporter permease subunit n=1 Tax=Paraburkholderia sp. UCT31 TaxID=2615209 RepID=UPI001654E2D6|nr:efflux RND transporter permease subunit [Paraburkholderia sp. UCT31]MBC8737229.1 efflux RND transporter permease subunit [Paraburkholderia sp. UCT31]